MARQMGWRRIAVGKSRSVVNAQGSKRLPRQIRVESGVGRILVVVIEREPARRRTEVRQPAVDGTKAVRGLIRINQVELADIPHLRRTNGQLVALDQRAVDGERQECIRIPDVVVIEEVLRQRVKVIDIDSPALNGNRQAELILLVAFAVQRNESQIVVLCKLQQGTLECGERRRLIVLAPEAAQKPIDPGKPHGRAEPWAGGILRHPTVEMRLTNAAGET